MQTDCRSLFCVSRTIAVSLLGLASCAFLASGPAARASDSSSVSKATLTVVSDFSSGKNPLAGRQVLLMRRRLIELLGRNGFHLSPRTTPAQAWVTLMNACPPSKNCDTLTSKLNDDIVTGFTMPASGRGEFDDSVPLGIYYVSCHSSLEYPVILLWEVKVVLKSGANSVTLSRRNAETIK
ncbi:MAG: hypothetical protein ACRESE_01945 [Gammaproteobacteria bacterium]